ncbi:MAG: hypothetical protein QM699_17980 [Amaricoccus sp.]|uniref:hypothetical protein n=1 Tax=Amaricoccus sp. TaxID=1872485 RepID=UPI0039E42F03
MRHDGGLLIALGAGLALALSLWNLVAPTGLFAPTSAIAWTPAALLAVAATLALFLAGLVLAGSARNPWLVAFLMLGTLVGIFGTAFTGRLIESPLLVTLMGVCLVGWIVRLVSRRPTA